MTALGKFQTQTFTQWKGVTKKNHLGSIFETAPQKMSNVMIQLMTANRGSRLESILSKLPKKLFETDDEYTWNIIGSSRKNIPIVEARDMNNNVITSGNAGVNGAPFYVVFAEDWFADGNTIVGELNEVYPLRVLGEPYMEGTNAVYKVELMGGVTTGMPYEELTEGKRFSAEYSVVEREFSRKVGDIRFSSPIAMRNEWSTIRISHKVAGNMLGTKLACGLPVIDSKGTKRVVNTWMHNVDMAAEEQFSEDKGTIIMYGTSNRNRNGEYLNLGKSGHVIRQGAGLREQMQVSNTIYYNKFSLRLIEDALFEISTAGNLKMSDRVFILRTGERGATQFHKAVLQEVSGWTQFTMNGDALQMVSKANSPLHSNALKAGFQFTEFRAPMGVIVKVEVDPFYDDPVRNKILHPDGGVTESYRYDIYNIGTPDVPNIQLTGIKGQEEIRGYQWGMRNPFTGQISNNNMSYDEDSCVMHKMWTGGVAVLDPTRTMSIIYSRD